MLVRRYYRLRREYGGYIEFEQYSGTLIHDDATALNCGRNCLAYLIEKRKIKKIYLPYFLCASVSDVCLKYGIDIEYYHVNNDLLPEFNKCLEMDEYLYVVNYYGQISNEQINEFKNLHRNLIVDNVQAYFQMPVPRTDTIYSCRKFFGVADGAFLYTEANVEGGLPVDESYKNMGFLMGRYERCAEEFYGGYVENNERFVKEPIKQISRLTYNLLRGIDYKYVSRIRKKNFSYLHDHLSSVNKLKPTIPEGAFMYPLYLNDGNNIRKKLQELRIYVPTLWPDVLRLCNDNTLEYNLAVNILPLPVDQRYNINDMEVIISEISKLIA